MNTPIQVGEYVFEVGNSYGKPCVRVYLEGRHAGSYYYTPYASEGQYIWMDWADEYDAKLPLETKNICRRLLANVAFS